MADEVVPAVEAEVEGLQLGVLPDGTPFLSGRSLANLCGVAPSVILEWGPTWSRESTRNRDKAITELLDQVGYTESTLFRKVLLKGVYTTAYPDAVAWAVLEYYAWDTGAQVSPQTRQRAIANYRKLARGGLRVFIYTACGYVPGQTAVPVEWRHFHERLRLNPVPRGYFSVWVESAALIMDAMRNGLSVDAHTVPDISIGQAWAKHWKDGQLEEYFGARSSHPHIYPADSPQSAADIAPAIYPIDALGEFRRWLYETYVTEKLPAYLKRKVREGVLATRAAELILDAVATDPAIAADQTSLLQK